MNLENELKTAIKVSREAGNKIIEIYNKDFGVSYKKDNSPVTNADKKANKIIVNSLKENFPDYAILSEESLDDSKRIKNKWCWIIDPLDGTKEFIKKNDEFTVNIALIYENRPVIGVIFAPALNDLYYGVKNEGSYYMNNFNSEAIEIKVSNKENNLRALKSRSHSSKEVNELYSNNKVSDIKKMGSSLKGCLIAKGEAEIYYRFNANFEWDVAAMDCIVTEAGGIFKELKNKKMIKYNSQKNVQKNAYYILNLEKNDLLN